VSARSFYTLTVEYLVHFYEHIWPFTSQLTPLTLRTPGPMPLNSLARTMIWFIVTTCLKARLGCISLLIAFHAFIVESISRVLIHRYFREMPKQAVTLDKFSIKREGLLKYISSFILFLYVTFIS
jgi:hypothetical protein